MTMTYTQLTVMNNSLDRELSNVYSENLELKDVIEQLKMEINTATIIMYTQRNQIKDKRLQ